MWNATCDIWHNYKYSLLSIDMKTKVVQHVSRINMSQGLLRRQIARNVQTACQNLGAEGHGFWRFFLGFLYIYLTKKNFVPKFFGETRLDNAIYDWEFSKKKSFFSNVHTGLNVALIKKIRALSFLQFLMKFHKMVSFYIFWSYGAFLKFWIFEKKGLWGQNPHNLLKYCLPCKNEPILWNFIKNWRKESVLTFLIFAIFHPFLAIWKSFVKKKLQKISKFFRAF